MTSPPGITQDALRMAKKMVRTIFPRHRFSVRECNELLHLLTLVAAEDLSGSGTIEWKSTPPSGTTLCFEDGSPRLIQSSRRLFVLGPSIPAAMVEKAGLRAEAILQRHGLDDEECGTLYTALPCLGLSALEEFVCWKAPPPFPELGS